MATEQACCQWHLGEGCTYDPCCESCPALLERYQRRARIRQEIDSHSWTAQGSGPLTCTACGAMATSLDLGWAWQIGPCLAVQRTTPQCGCPVCRTVRARQTEVAAIPDDGPPLPNPLPANPYNEDGYCLWCDNARGKHHGYECAWQDKRDQEQEATSLCWRHDLGHREYVCTCSPPRAGDTGLTPEQEQARLAKRAEE